jgi:probable rRNA maturation factor
LPYDISVEVTLEPPADFEAGALPALAERVMAGESIADGTSLSILVCGDDEVREMNRMFLGVDEPTDVLSFPDEADDFIVGQAQAPLLGDIAIALPTAQRQAAEIGHSLDAEVAHLLVHGILHLCGYDHVDDAEAEARMRAREESYLGHLGTVHHH